VKKFASILMIAALVAFMVAPAAMACGGSKSTDAKASCSGKAEATKTGADCAKTCTAAKTCTGAKTTEAVETMPNGHPMMTVAEAMKCPDAKIAFMNVNKMMCGSCVEHVTKTLGSIEGVCAVDVNLKNASATVVFHPSQVKTDDMIKAIDKAGYAATMKTECTAEMKAVCGSDCPFDRCANMVKAGKTCTKKAETSET